MNVRYRISFLTLLMFCIAYAHAVSQPVQNGYAAVTCYSDQAYGNPDGIVAALIDVRLAHLQPFDLHWPATKYMGPGNSWKRSNLGEVFGIAFDAAGNFYLASSSVYTGAPPAGPGGNGAIYKIDGVTGSITNFVTTLNAACGSVVGTSTIPNTGNGLGNIAFDAANNQFFATNFEDGKIYRIDASGVIQSVFDPFAPDGCTAGTAPFGELLWGIGVYNGRVYFSRWSEDCGTPSASSANEIWSVALNGSGDFTGTEQLDISIPILPSTVHSNPVADIEFSAGGRMILAERTMKGVGNSPLYPNAHASRVLEYVVVASVWTSTGSIFDIGVSAGSGCGSWPGGYNSAGGVDYAYGAFNPQTNELRDCDSTVWASGDALKFSGQVVYGFQRLPASGGNPGNSVLIDADGNLGAGDKTQIGDIDIYKHCGVVPGDPCKDIRVTSKQIDQAGGTGCCFELTITGVPAGTFSSISAALLTASVSFTGVIGPTGWNVTNTGTFATWDSAGTIPGGTLSGLTFCLYSLVSPPQLVEITFYAADGTICKDTLTFDCPRLPPPFPPCMIVNDTVIECKETGPNGSFYDLSFTVTNQSIFSLPPYNQPAENLIVYSGTPGVNVSPGGVALSPVLGYNQTSGPLNFTLSGPGVQPGATVCIVLQLHGKKLEHDYQWCCPPDTLCFVLLPCKDCCDSVDISVKGGVKPKGNNGAIVQSTVTVTPGPVIKAQASIMSVTRSTVWCPKFKPNLPPVYVPVAAGGPMLAQITNAVITPPMPLSYGITPPTSEVIWGTVPSGVTMGGNIGLGISFPGSSLGWRCRDTLTICVRYTFTDTACHTCDTVICYTLPRFGEIEIIDHKGTATGVISRSPEESTLYEDEGLAGDSPLHGDKVDGPKIDLVMTNLTDGALSLAHWWQDDLSGSPTIRLTQMIVEPEVGIDIRSLRAQASGAQGTISDRIARIPLELNPREIDLFDIRFDNPNQIRYFSLKVRYRYVDVDNPRDTMLSRAYIVIASIPGESGGDIVANDDQSDRPVGVRTFMLYFVNNNLLKRPISQVVITVNEEGGDAPVILAVGPPNEADPRTVTLGAVEDMTGRARHEIAMNAIGNIRARIAPGDSVLPIYVTVGGIGDKPLKLEYTTYDADGAIISNGEVEVNDPLGTTAAPDDDRATAGTSVMLYPVAPNPGGGDRTVRFQLMRTESNVTLAIYDLSGREVARLIDGRRFTAGTHTLIYSPDNLPSGTYYVVLKTTGEQVSTTMHVVE